LSAPYGRCFSRLKPNARRFLPKVGVASFECPKVQGFAIDATQTSAECIDDKCLCRRGACDSQPAFSCPQASDPGMRPQSTPMNLPAGPIPFHVYDRVAI